MPVIHTQSITVPLRVTSFGVTYVSTEDSSITSTLMGVRFSNQGSVTYVLEGKIYADGDGIQHDATRASANNSVSVENSGLIVSGADGMDLHGDLNSVVMRGTITAAEDGIALTGNRWDLDLSGDVRGSADGISLTGNAAYLDISGNVSGRAFGIDLLGDRSVIVNTGEITGREGGA